MSANESVIHWFRRDLRISDNTALHYAIATGLPVVCVYVLSDWKGSHAWTGAKRQHFLCGCLASLSKNLESIGAKLLIRSGNPTEVLLNLAKECQARTIFTNRDPDPFGKKTEADLAIFLQQENMALETFHDVSLHAPSEVLNLAGLPYRVFTPYSKNWLNLAKPLPFPSPKQMLPYPKTLVSDPLPDLAHWGLRSAAEDFSKLPEASERAARIRLKSAISEKIERYQLTRDFPAANATSRLSQDLRHGLLSIRTIYAQAKAAQNKSDQIGQENIHVFIKELAWREFYFAILDFFPEVLRHEFNSDWRGLTWLEPDERFELWRTGQTGFPIVDAGIRELLATGHMHNRVRMIVAMFLTKDLHVDWRYGESFFMQHLLDGEIASNNGGWQWSAGTGADAAPYFRIQNPWLQSSRFDQKGEYIKRWIPELADVEDVTVFHAPPKNGVPIANCYPMPCLDHQTERDLTLKLFKQFRNSTPV